MPKTKIVTNRDILIKANRLEIRLSKLQKEQLTEKAKKQGLTITDFIIKECGLTLLNPK
jgi:uncharacterized protein (DUF1778 family)